MAVKESNMFGSGKNFDNQIAHDRLTGSMFYRGVIRDVIKPLREKYGASINTSFKDDISVAVRKELAEKNVQRIDGVFGKFVGLTVSERQGGEGTYREATVQLADPDSGEIDDVILDATSMAGQLVIHKLATVQPGEVIEVRMFSGVSDADEDGRKFVNHYGAINREGPQGTEKIAIEGNERYAAIMAKAKETYADLTAKKASKLIAAASREQVKADGAIAVAKEIEARMVNYKATHGENHTAEHVIHDDEDETFGDGNFEPQDSQNKPRP